MIVRTRNTGCMQFFEDDFGRKSQTRLVQFILTLVSSFVAIWTTVHGNPNSGVELIAVLLSIPTIGKGVKGFYEQQEKALVETAPVSAIAAENGQ